MTVIDETFEINAPPEAVWSIIADRQGIPKLQPRVVAVETDPPGMAVPGQKFVLVYAMAGRKMRVHGEHVEAVPNRLLKSKHRPGGMFQSFEDTMELMPSPNGTRVRTLLEYELARGLIGRLLGWLFVDRSIRGDAKNYWKNVRRLAEHQTLSGNVSPLPASVRS